jgi:chromosome segregation ATPase
MRQAARVLSTDALRDFRSALARFSARAREGLRSALLETRHTLDWLDKQLDAWRREAEKRHEAVLRCRSELAVARSAPENMRSAATEREIDLRKAMARLKEAEEKVEAVRRWKRTLPQIVNEHELPMRRLGGFLDGDVQYALALLDGKIESLKAYVALTAPEAPAVTVAPSPAPAVPANSTGGQP